MVCSLIGCVSCVGNNVCGVCVTGSEVVEGECHLCGVKNCL